MRIASTPTFVPHALGLPDGSVLFVRVPSAMTTVDRDGSTSFTPDGIRLLDRLRAMAMATPARPTPGYIRTVRGAMNLTQADFAAVLGYSTISVKKWETGAARPGTEAVERIRRLVDRAGRRGVVIGAE